MHLQEYVSCYVNFHHEIQFWKWIFLRYKFEDINLTLYAMDLDMYKFSCFTNEPISTYQKFEIF